MDFKQETIFSVRRVNFIETGSKSRAFLVLFYRLPFALLQIHSFHNALFVTYIYFRQQPEKCINRIYVVKS